MWPVDRLASDVSQLSKDITRLENQMQIAGGTRTVADVDGELEQLDSEKSEKERARDELLRKQSRLRYPHMCFDRLAQCHLKRRTPSNSFYKLDLSVGNYEFTRLTHSPQRQKLSITTSLLQKSRYRSIHEEASILNQSNLIY